ncbi:FtsQ-type POTRA domain-containing protein [Streptococcus gallolyticus]|nr:FtsQ-type POTRA domain-containing protein [Streptococcus gallolyticus]MBY5041738.1 FtsQ-type POTRA domain-containing protein [Streptococcus gallolyticus]
MTEKDVKNHENLEELAGELEEKEDLEQVETTPVETGSQEDETAANSDFFQQWKARHQAYLASQKEEEQEGEAEDQPARLSLQELRKSLRQAEKKSVESADEPVKKIKKNPIPAIVIWKSLPVFFVSMVLILASLYFISPLSKYKTITVKGNTHLSSNKILSYSQISSRDYALTTFLHMDAYAKNIEKTSNWIKSAKISYQFPKSFTIQVEEYTKIGYVETGGKYYSVLSSGNISDTATESSQLPKQYTSIHLNDRVLIQKLVRQLAKVNPNIVANIETIDLTPTKVTSDLLTLTMHDGNKILIPLAEVERKLPYYEKIAPQLAVASVVDMEVGIFSYAQ